MKSLIRSPLLFGLVIVFSGTTLLAQVTNLFNFDEFGHGLIQTNGGNKGTFGAVLAPDTTPAGLANWNVLTYTLPFLGTAGDLLIQDAAQPGNPILDVLRFDGASHVIIYSDSLDGYEAPGDTPGPPNLFLPNRVLAKEQGVDEVYSWADYTPALNDPGWDPVMAPSYHFLSDGVIPEPGGGLLLLTGLGVFGLAQMRRSFASRIKTTHSRAGRSRDEN